MTDRSHDIDGLVARLPREVPPETDLWPRIEAAIGRSGAVLGVPGLNPEIAPPEDLWPRIRAQLGPQRPQVATAAPGHRFLAAASLAAVASVAALLAFVASERLSTPARFAATGSDELWWVGLLERTQRASGPAGDARELAEILEFVRGEYVAVRDERFAIEAALDRNPSSPVLSALWRHTYEQELALTTRAQEIADSYERG